MVSKSSLKNTLAPDVNTESFLTTSSNESGGRSGGMTPSMIAVGDFT